jgi:hypothetical protein
MALALVPSTASAHQTVPGVVDVLDRVVPPLPAGVTVQVAISVSDQLVVANPTATDLVVLGDEGEPFLRIGSQGTSANLRSPTWYRDNDPTGSTPAPPPPKADATAAPEFVRVSTEPNFGWFDHRLHRQAMSSPIVVRPGQNVVQLGSWSVPMRYGGHAVQVLGHREYRHPLGVWAQSVQAVPAGVQVVALPGLVPGLFARLAGDQPVTFLGQEGEPIAKLEKSGASVNVASPTWAFTVRAKTGTAPPPATTSPQWVVDSPNPQVTWLDTRGQGPEPPVGRPPAVRSITWRVPVLVGDKRAEIVGRTDWVPYPTLPRLSRRPAWWGWAVAVALGSVFAGGLWWIVRGRVRP